MVVKLYTLDMSPPVRACMMACEIFNVPFEKIPVNLMAGEHLTPEYLKKNPLHTVPVMEDGDVTLHDSHAIMAYLADTYGKDESWYPKDVKKRALVNQKLFFDTAIIFPRLRNITYNIVMKGKTTIEPELMEAIAEAYGFMEAFLSRTKYIAADNVTIADIGILAVMTSLEHILPVEPKKYPKTSTWLQNMKATPYCKKWNEEGANALGAYVKSKVALMVVKLYTYEMSPSVRACMMACEIFNVPFEKVPIDLQAGEHLTPEFLKKNPLHQVPVMEDGDLTIHDSHAILPYLADTFGKDDSWYPKDVKKRALVNQKLIFNAVIVFARARNITYHIVLRGKTTIEQELIDDVTEAYGFIETFLSSTKYIAGDHITIADIAILAVMTSITQIVKLDAQKFPKTSAWLENLKKQPYYKKYDEAGANELAAYVNSKVA
ncbi:uncharacterized protein LOC118261723 [Spodoptera frugiperda]|uniref:Uncharacterized protein LOC118261723 n=1 Tax=Spodoptera frugiperda TaxID=7108 RepID=A0A9R0E347_SPOFR|nr:uncharacterized protein LOC118261723 [Spodoptera frugiperda]